MDAVYELPEPETVAFHEFTMPIELPKLRSTDQPLVDELPLLVTVKLAVNPLPQSLMSPTEQLIPTGPPDVLDEELDELLELLVEELELLLDELLELSDPLVISPVDAVSVNLSSPALSSRLSIRKV